VFLAEALFSKECVASLSFIQIKLSTPTHSWRRIVGGGGVSLLLDKGIY
jgi:hypothetical protein